MWVDERESLRESMRGNTCVLKRECERSCAGQYVYARLCRGGVGGVLSLVLSVEKVYVESELWQCW